VTTVGLSQAVISQQKNRCYGHSLIRQHLVWLYNYITILFCGYHYQFSYYYKQENNVKTGSSDAEQGLKV